MGELMLPIFARATGKRVWRNDMYRLEVWEPDAGEAEHGLRTEFADGIYIVTVHEDTPTDWLDLARRASVAAYEQHPGPNFMPASNYDSAIAVADRRVVGGTLVRLESAPRYNCDRMARPIPLMTYLERKARAGLRLVRRGNGLRPLIRSGSSRASRGRVWRTTRSCCCRALRSSFVETMLSVALSKQAVRMVQRLGLNTIMGCD